MLFIYNLYCSNLRQISGLCPDTRIQSSFSQQYKLIGTRQLKGHWKYYSTYNTIQLKVQSNDWKIDENRRNRGKIDENRRNRGKIWSKIVEIETKSTKIIEIEAKSTPLTRIYMTAYFPGMIQALIGKKIQNIVTMTT
jgi:hypothetical protein